MRTWLPATALLLLVLLLAGCGTGKTYLHQGSTSSPAAVGRSSSQLVVVTFNVHDLYVVGRDRKRRMRLIGETLTRLDPDVVGIQESFIGKDREVLLDSLSGSRLRNHAYFDYGKTGSGLLILSALPILETDFYEYQNKGKWWKIWHGDYWAGKGVALTRVSFGGGGGVLDFYNTHAQASYVEEGEYDEYQTVRLAQMKEMRDFVLETTRSGNPALLVGDFNCKPGMEDYELLVRDTRLDRLLTVPTEWDHIFALRKPGWRYTATPTKLITTAQTAEGEEIHLSDHDGYLTKITITRKGGGQ